MYERRFQYVASKWTKAKLLMENEIIQPYLPDIRLFTVENLEQMLKQYHMVYLKPEYGMKGKGIIRLTCREELFILDTTNKTLTFSVFDNLSDSLKKITRRYKYVIQQGVELLVVDESLIDFRVLLQRPIDKWVYSGIIGKLGVKNSIVTNLAVGGKAVPFQQALDKTLKIDFEQLRTLYHEIRSLCMTIATQLTKEFPGLREIGVDLAIDSKQKIWILEVNTTPGHQLFRSHPNHKVFQRIIQNVRLIQANTT